MFKRGTMLGLSLALILASFTAVTPAQAATSIAAVCSAGTCTVSVTDTTTAYEWTVPSGVTSATFTITGGQGGAGSSGAGGGWGGKFTGTLNLTAGQVISLWAGAAGGNATTTRSLSGGRSSGGGGGSSGRMGGAGGAHSQIDRAGTVVAIAAGGGGGGGWSGGTGGGGGSSTFSAGVANGVNGTDGQAYLGYGGTTSGGAGGAASGGGGSAGSAGSSLSGGAGGAGSAASGGGGGGGYFGGGGGGGDNDGCCADGAGGGGGSNYYNSASVSSVTGFAASQSGNGSIVLTYPSTAVSSFTPSTSLTNSTSLTFALVFSENVTGLTASDLTLTGTGASSCAIGSISGSGSSYSIPLSSCSQGTIALTLLANSVSGTASGPGANVTSSYATVDTSAPIISSVSAPTNQTYIPTNTISFTANMSETVTVSGSPRLALTIGSTTRYATYASGSNSKALVFSYTVQTSANDIDVDGIAISTTLELNSGSITDLAANALSALTFTAPSLTSVLVAQKPSAPTIDSISATSGQISINFSAGASNGSAITNYEYSINNGSNWTARSPVATTSPIVITGLSNGTSYSVRIRAVNGAGAGDSSTAVSATPSAVTVTGGSDISIIYGGSASSTPFSAAGGTGSYTWSLSSTPTGVSISGSTVTASNATPAGTYTANVTATDTGSPAQVASKQISITVSKASSSISISLPGGASSAALGGAVTISAVVSRAGSVNFKLGGTTISGCGAAAAASTTATCTWTPNSLGGVSITAVFTPTESSNYDVATSSALSVTVVNGVSTVTLSLAGGTTTPQKSKAINIIAAIDQAGRVTFSVDGKRLIACTNILASAGNVTCAWKPAIQKQSTITARLVPTNSVYNSSTSSLIVRVIKRTGTR